MKNLWNKLKPDYQLKIRKASHKYDSARRLKYTLMSKTSWHELTIQEISDITVYGSVYFQDLSASDIMYGLAMLKK